MKTVYAGGPGDLDPSFDTDGIVITSFSGYDASNAIVIQADGKIVAAGRGDGSKFVLARYNTDGSLDTSFGGDGKVSTRFDDGSGRYVSADAQSVIIQDDGKIVAAGYISGGNTQEGDFALARYNTDGSLDTSFGGDGMVMTSINGNDRGFAAAIQPDGKIVVTGFSGTSYPYDLVLIRYNTDGNLDNSFGTNGIVVADLAKNGGGFDIAILPDNKILVASQYGTTMMLIRYNTNGITDTSFDSNSTFLSFVGCFHPDCDFALQNDGKIVMTGWHPNYDFTVARHNSNGSLDTSFNTNGEKVRTNLGGIDVVHDVVIQNDGKIIAIGKSSEDFALARYNSDGSLDTSFGDDGKIVTDLGGEDYGNAVAIQDDGKILVAGEKGFTSASDFAIVRYLGCTGPYPCLTIAKTVELGSDPIQPGDPLTYTVVVANQGGGDANGVVVTDTLPTYLGGAGLNQTVDITAGESVTFTLNVTLSDSTPFGEVITNTAFFSHTSDSSQDDVAFTVAGPPQLAITKTVQLASNPIQPGDPLTYTITVANQGAGNANDVVVTDTLPTYIEGIGLNQTVDITAGESITFTLNATLSDSTPFGKMITNTAFFSHILDSGQDETVITVAEAPRLIITKTVELGSDPTQPGDPLTYTIVVANQGLGDANNVVITDTLPTYIEGAGLNQTVDITTGESITFTLNVTLSSSVPFGEVITNTAFFSHPSDGGQDSSVFSVKGTEKAYLPVILNN